MTAQGESRNGALDTLDAVVEAVEGDGGRLPIDEGIRDLGVDPEHVARIVERYPVRCAVLYGSQIRGTATADSDVDIDVADLDTIRPEIGLSALRTGRVLLGTQETIEDYRDRFERETTVDDETHEQRMRRFDSILEQLEGRV